MPRTSPVIALGALLALAACDDPPPPPTAPAAAPAKAAAPAPDPAPAAAVASGALEIRDGAGALRLRLTAKDGGGYRIEDGGGAKIGKVSIESDRVKVKDATGAPRAKVKKKESGFKLYAPDDSVILKGKLDGGSGLKLKRDDGTKVGKLDGAFGKIGEQKVEAKVIPGGVEVRRGGTLVATVTGALAAEPAALLALDDLDPYQQAALLVFVKEVW